MSAVAVIATVMAGCGADQPKPGTVLDEAMRANRSAASMPAAGEDYFHNMDGALPLSPEEVQGRNTWLVWTGGNDRLWDRMTVESVGTFDLLKTVSSHRAVGYGRHNRWTYLGLVNEPCFAEATAADPDRFGLWLDVRDPGCAPDPFADDQKYPGVKLGARGSTVRVGSYYGEPTGVVGLRLFPNPDFDENARKKWNAERYYNDPAYYMSKDVVRPYRVGMSCGFCHAGPSPVRPPADPENPKWENLSSNVGAQYFWVDRIFNWRGDANPESFFYQLFHTARPGSLDTSLVSTDNINNPRTMNAVYYLGPRMGVAAKWGKETLAGGGLRNKQFNDFVPPGSPLSGFFAAPATTFTPRVLKDGADSVGALGALNRVYLNIGLFSEEWLLHFRPIVGGKPISPIQIDVAERNSAYWRATEQQTVNMARFFLASTDPHHLKDAPGGDGYLTADAGTLQRGKVVFAERCARCHSSTIPPLPAGLDLANANGPEYLRHWNDYWAWSKTEAFKSQMRPIVLKEDFLKDNYLSTELRVPITLLQVNACSPMATNAIAGNVWDNFSSASYKSLPSVGSIKVRHPVTGAASDYVIPGGGRGFVRPASLVSAWSTAPFLQNNTVGHFDPSPSVEARMRVFEDAIGQLLWPERRAKDPIFAEDRGAGVGVIDRLTQDAFIDVPDGYIPDYLRPVVGTGRRLFPFLFNNGSVRVGPIPKGLPIGLIANLDLLGADLTSDAERRAHRKKLLELVVRAKREFKAGKDLGAVLAVLVDPMLEMSKCRDFVVNKGHYFGTDLMQAEEPGLSDTDKNALIAFVKTF